MNEYKGFEQEKPKKNNKKYTIADFVLGVKVPQGTTPEEKKQNLEGALRHFKKMIKDCGIIEEYRERGEYLKPSVKNRENKKAALRRNERAVQEEKEKSKY